MCRLLVAAGIAADTSGQQQQYLGAGLQLTSAQAVYSAEHRNGSRSDLYDRVEVPAR